MCASLSARRRRVPRDGDSDRMGLLGSVLSTPNLMLVGSARVSPNYFEGTASLDGNIPFFARCDCERIDPQRSISRN